MKFDSKWYFKWISSSEELIQGKTFEIVNKCVLLARELSGQVKGFTVFETKDFSEVFLKRLEERRNRPESASLKFSLYLPTFLKHRADGFEISKTLSNVIYTPFVYLKFDAQKVIVRDKLRVVSVDDSPVLLKFLKHTMLELGFIDVVAQISDPLKAVAEIKKHRPDLVTMDIQMPGKTGVSVVQDLLAVEYYPVLMISSLAMEEGSLVFDALNAGAFDYIQKPKLEEKEDFKEDLAAKGLMAVSKTGSSANQKKKSIQVIASKSVSESSNKVYADNLIWCIGSSTGGTQALTQVFTSLPTHIPAILVVQHIPPIFSKAFADSLNKLCPFTVKEAENGDTVKPDHIYIAPGGFQMAVEGTPGHLRLLIKDDPPVNRFKPSVDYMFSTVAKLKGLSIVAGILTGMGKDGALGLLELKKKGARTFAQDEESSAVYGMPRAAFEVGATSNMKPLELIAQTLLEESVDFQKAKKSA